MTLESRSDIHLRKEEERESSLGNHGDVDQDLSREARDRLRIRLERMVPMFPAVEPGVVFRRQVGSFTALDAERRRVVEEGGVRVRGQEALEGEGEQVGDLGAVQFRLPAGKRAG